jgi:hypothetical protein
MNRNNQLAMLAFAALGYVWTPLAIIGVLVVAFAPILLLAFVPASGPILAAAGILAIGCVLSVLAGRAARNAVRLQQVQAEHPLLRSSLGRRPIILAWTAYLTATVVGAGLIILALIILSRFLAE